MIPAMFERALWRYVEAGIPPGSFLRSVLENNLLRAVINADPASREVLAEVALWVLNHVPDPIWGSDEKVKNWISESKKARPKP